MKKILYRFSPKNVVFYLATIFLIFHKFFLIITPNLTARSKRRKQREENSGDFPHFILSFLFSLQNIYKAKMKAKIAGMRASTVAAVNFVALLHPSWPHVSQNSVLIYDGVVVLIQLSAGAFMSSHEQDREMTILSLTVDG